MNTYDRMKGALWGAIIGDALGVPLEMKSRESLVLDPVIDMRENGAHNMPCGAWSDDGSMILCSAESLLNNSFDMEKMIQSFIEWYRNGKWTPTGKSFGSGGTIRGSLERYENGVAWDVCGATKEEACGNGSLMRILPISLATMKLDDETAMEIIAKASALTHAQQRAIISCKIYTEVLRLIINVPDENHINLITWAISDACIEQSPSEKHPEYEIFKDLRENVRCLAEPLKTSSYVIETLTASLWCARHSESFKEGVLKAVNLGGDSDTTGSVTGGLLGAYYGYDAIPKEWINAVKEVGNKTDVEGMIEKFLEKFAGS